MQVTDKIRQRLGTWTDLFVPFIESPTWDGIFDKLFAINAKGRQIIPKSEDVFKSFELCDRNKLKAVVILMDPYPSLTNDNKMIANGVPLSCAGKDKMQPSLEIWYSGMDESLFGFNPNLDKRLDNSYLLVEEGVLMLNSSLTCEVNKPGSHLDIWTPFMQYFIEEILNKYYSGLPIVLCGAQAQKLEKFISPLLHYIKKIEHPVAASYANRAWKHDNMFSWCNQIITSNNGEEFVIKWHREKGVQSEKCEKQKPVPGTKEPLKSAEELGLPWKD
jgi:uracil-DNA glycosylase